jgi:hypothetical protein
MTPLVSFCFRAQCGWLLVTLASPNFDLRRLTVSFGSFWRERRFEIPDLGYTATGQMSPTIIETEVVCRAVGCAISTSRK